MRLFYRSCYRSVQTVQSLYSRRLISFSIHSRYLRTSFACMMAENTEDKVCASLGGSPTAESSSVSLPNKCPEKETDSIRCLESNVYRSKYGPNSIRKRQRQTSNSQSSESDNKRSLASDPTEQSLWKPIGLSSTTPCDHLLSTPESAATESVTTTTSGTSGRPIDLTEDPAVLAVGDVIHSGSSRGTSFPKVAGQTGEGTQAAIQMANNRLAMEQAKHAKKVATLVDRPWEYPGHKSRHTHQTDSKRSLLFTVMSYNVLAQNLLEDNVDLYCSSKKDYLSWSYRSCNMLKELSAANADILCLQEVTGEHYVNFFKPELAKLGYSGVFKQRTGDKQDGCATFFKTIKFELEKSVPVEYLKPGVDVLNRDNVGLVVLLRTRNRHRALCVANTHLLFNPKRGDVKLAQLMVLFSEIDKLCYIENSQSRAQDRHPVIMCGDLNAEPNCDLYRLVVQGFLRYEGLLSKFVAGRKEFGGRDNYLTNVLVPPYLGISDQCQYMDLVRGRNHRLSQSAALVGEDKDAKNTQSRNCMPVMSQTGGAVDTHSANAATSLPGQSTHRLCDSVDTINPEGHRRRGQPHSQALPPVYPSNDNRSTAVNVQEQSQGQARLRAVPNTREPQHLSRQPRGEDFYHLCTQSSGSLSHDLKLTSVYRHDTFVQHHNRSYWHREVTTHHGKTNCTVDYIFYSVKNKRTFLKHHRVRTHDLEEGKLRLVAKVRLPTEADMVQVGQLPNELVSSDHVMLMAKFLLKL